MAQANILVKPATAAKAKELFGDNVKDRYNGLNHSYGRKYRTKRSDVEQELQEKDVKYWSCFKCDGHGMIESKNQLIECYECDGTGVL